MAGPGSGCLIQNNGAPRWPRPAQRARIGGFGERTSAAQNGPVIHICSQCGALILEDVERCSFCDSPLVANDDAVESVPVGAFARATSGENLEELLHVSLEARASAPARARTEHAELDAEEPEWRREVSRRLEEYRARRRRYHPDDSQTGLPFGYEPELEEGYAEREAAERPRVRTAQRQRAPERVEICIQPELNFSSAPDDRAHPQTALVPVADLSERRRCGALDTLFLALAYAGFLGIFRSFGGHLAIEKVDAVVYLAAFFLFYAQYFALFTTFAGATPGMQLRGLTIVRLDGSLPDTRQLVWRSFGYILSAATLMLGFLWALWDEDRFTWQDRISQTYITAAAPLTASEPLDVRGQQRFAHK